MSEPPQRRVPATPRRRQLVVAASAAVVLVAGALVVWLALKSPTAPPETAAALATPSLSATSESEISASSAVDSRSTPAPSPLSSVPETTTPVVVAPAPAPEGSGPCLRSGVHPNFPAAAELTPRSVGDPSCDEMTGVLDAIDRGEDSAAGAQFVTVGQWKCTYSLPVDAQASGLLLGCDGSDGRGFEAHLAAAAVTEPTESSKTCTDGTNTYDVTGMADPPSCEERIAVWARWLQLHTMDVGDGWNCFPAEPYGQCSTDADTAFQVIPAQPGVAGERASDGGGDLGLSIPVSSVGCDGTVIVIFGSAVSPSTYSSDVQALLDAHPGSSYLRTDQACTSLVQATQDGKPLYAVYQSFGTDVAAACAAAPGDASVRRLENSGNPGTSTITC